MRHLTICLRIAQTGHSLSRKQVYYSGFVCLCLNASTKSNITVPYFFEKYVGEARATVKECYILAQIQRHWCPAERRYVTYSGLHEEHSAWTVISRRGDIFWPRRLCDFTPLNFFLLGFLKYKSAPINALRVIIFEAIAQPYLCERIIGNLTTWKRNTYICNIPHLMACMSFFLVEWCWGSQLCRSAYVECLDCR